jgi:hypothetical protein
MFAVLDLGIEVNEGALKQSGRAATD